ncbi:nuclear transport factor 2 family protein [Brevundimonas sp. 2R-24]|uniref:Nuclear transport factor 2 family protein n=1 Tax=Peiella sedimenti TaxID=3061083 RepID=A0ABT8SH65_9CAUL|nr:nuclear transport factor 2 family protein [Caulobacteraceae bacterium XZ-24]
MMRARLLAAATALVFTAGCAHAQTANAPDALEIAAAERAFAADHPSMGTAGSFLKWAEPTAIMFAGGRPAPVTEVFADAGPRDPNEPSLFWWPNWVGIAMSGDLGISTGGVEVGGRRAFHYFTVWRRQADGGWKWVYDGGAGANAADVPGPDTQPQVLPTATVGSASPEAAMAEVRAAEQRLAEAAAVDQRAAHLSVLAEDGRVYVAPLPPVIGAAAYAEGLRGWPETFRFGEVLGGGASNAGDLVWTYAQADWTREGQARSGHYVHVWQKRPEGWKLVFAQIVPNPPPQAQPPANS